MSRAALHVAVTRRERAADWIAGHYGSWAFVLGQLAFCALWAGWNIGSGHPFDPWPLIALNLFLSLEAAVQGGVLQMSSNRAAARDRARDDLEADEVARLLTLNETQLQILQAIHELTVALHTTEPR